MRCDSCRHWELGEYDTSSHQDDQQGCCKRYPPALDAGAIATRYLVNDEIEFETEAKWHFWQQPITTAANYCGEFERPTI